MGLFITAFRYNYITPRYGWCSVRALDSRYSRTYCCVTKPCYRCPVNFEIYHQCYYARFVKRYERRHHSVYRVLRETTRILIYRSDNLSRHGHKFESEKTQNILVATALLVLWKAYWKGLVISWYQSLDIWKAVFDKIKNFLIVWLKYIKWADARNNTDWYTNENGIGECAWTPFETPC